MSNIYPWQLNHWQQLQQAKQLARLPHAMLLVAPEGSGKTVFAKALAKSLLCENITAEGYACDNCKACSLFNAGTHPDHKQIAIAKDESSIKINSIRQLSQFLQASSVVSQYRTVVINDADKMTTAAANALLKTLEEPGNNNILILSADELTALPATIRSRCQIFNLLAEANLAQQFLIDNKLNSDDASLLLQLAAGAPLTALQYSQDSMLQLRQQIIREILLQQTTVTNAVGIAKQCEQLKISLASLIVWLLSICQDAVYCQLGLQHSLVNTDMSAELTPLYQSLSLAQWLAVYDNGMRNLSLLRSPNNLNNNLLCESFLQDCFKIITQGV